MNLQSNLEQIGASLLGNNRVPVGIVTPSPVQHQSYTYVPNQQFSMDPEKDTESWEEQELLDQLNVALEVMATGNHL